MSDLETQRLGGPTNTVLARATRMVRVEDVPAIRAIVDPLVQQRRIAPLSAASFYDSLQRFRVVETAGEVIGCGALQVVWGDLAEIRTVAVLPEARGRGTGSVLLVDLLGEAESLGIRRVFCLTFETEFFGRHGFVPIQVSPVSSEVYGELLRCYDEDIARSLDLARVRPNTLGNTCMELDLD